MMEQEVIVSEYLLKKDLYDGGRGDDDTQKKKKCLLLLLWLIPQKHLTNLFRLLRDHHHH